MNNRKVYTTIFLILLILAIGGSYYLYKQGFFSKKVDTTQKEEKKEEGQSLEEYRTKKGLLFTLESPKPNATISCKFKLIGRMPNSWFFEGNFPVKVVVDGNTVYTGQAHTEEDWTKQENLLFYADIDCKDKCVGNGSIVLMNSNPSGIPENDDSYTIPVLFDSTCEVEVETKEMKVKVFFSNTTKDPNAEKCEETYFVERVIPETVAVGRASILELLKGVTATEKTKGYTTAIPVGTVLKNITVKEGVAYVDFNSKLQEGIGGACLTDKIKSQIENTLKQFSTVKSVVISIDGKSEGVLQP